MYWGLVYIEWHQIILPCLHVFRQKPHLDVVWSQRKKDSVRYTVTKGANWCEDPPGICVFSLMVYKWKHTYHSFLKLKHKRKTGGTKGQKDINQTWTKTHRHWSLMCTHGSKSLKQSCGLLVMDQSTWRSLEQLFSTWVINLIHGNMLNGKTSELS